MAKSKYEAQNRIEGLSKAPLELGDVVELDDEAAAPFVAGGSLKPAPESAAAPKSDKKKAD